MYQVAIIDAGTGSVSLHTIPAHINTDEGREKYVRLELNGDDSEFIIAEKLIVDDFRTGRICEHTGELFVNCKHN